MVALEKLLIFAFDLLLPMCIGYWLHARNMARKEQLDRLMVGNLLVLSPLLTLLAFWKISIPLAYAWLPVLGMLMQLLPGGMAFFWGRHKFSDPHEQGGYLLAATFANRSVIGILSVYALYGENGYALSRMVMLLGPAAFYMIGFPMAQYYYQNGLGDSAPRPTIRSVFFQRNQLPVLGLVAGAMLNTWGPARPDALNQAFKVLLHINMWLFILPIGYGIRFGEMKKYWTRVLDLLVLKFVLTPVMIYALAWAVGLQGAALGAVVILSFTPAAIGAVIAAKINKLNEHLPLAAYFLTSAVYLILIFPLLAYLFSSTS